MNPQSLYDLSPLLRIALLGTALAAGPLAWLWLRQRRAAPPARLHALTVLTLFLTFDLVVFGAFTRLSDSGLGCPDWPGCYGSASPLGASDHIASAQRALPGGPVTHGKAWVEMIHRYLATVVGMLITVMAAAAWWSRLRNDRRRSPLAPSPWWATATLVWVCVQGAFGALTVTMKLYPAIVTLHLLGGLVLLALLAAQSQAGQRSTRPLPPALRAGVWAVLALAFAQIALGGWVSSNYAVLACSDFPTCQGSWWPPMDTARGFTVWRALGTAGGSTADATQGVGDWLPFTALTAIHMAHRIGAAVLLSAMALLAWRLGAFGSAHGDREFRSWALGLASIGVWQAASGIGNVVLGWPFAAALAHTAGAAALVVLLTALLVRSRRRMRLLVARQAVVPAFPAVRSAS